MIDIIIPCYNSHNTLIRCLGSILSQNNLDELKVTLVNDGGESYTDIIKDFSKYMNIQEIGYTDNRSVGYARRYGFLNTSNPFIVYIDSDDTFSNTFALTVLRKNIVCDNKIAVCSGGFIAEYPDRLVEHAYDMLWMHGKIYRRSFLEKYNILMQDSSANEDAGFNLLCNLIIDGTDNKLRYIKDTVYVWHNNPNSIVRKNVKNYSDNLSFIGYVDNTIWAFKEANKFINVETTLKERIRVFIKIFISYIKALRSSEYKDQNLLYSKKFYNEVLKPIESLITPEIFLNAYNSFPKSYTDKYSIESIYSFLQVLNH